MNAHTDDIKTFRDSLTFDRQKKVRSAVKSTSRLTKSQKTILLKMFSLWEYHKKKRWNGGGYINPGRVALAKEADCEVLTVSRALSLFRREGMIKATKHLKGYEYRTHYTVDPDAILAFCGGRTSGIQSAGVDTLHGGSNEGSNDTLFEMMGKKHYQNDTLLNDERSDTSEEEEGSSQGQETSDDYLPIEESLIDYDEDWSDWQPCAPFGAFGDDHE
jgi:hypothetical protein